MRRATLMHTAVALIVASAVHNYLHLQLLCRTFGIFGLLERRVGERTKLDLQVTCWERFDT